MDPRVPSTSQPGVRRLADPRVWGTFVGAVGGSVFVHDNRHLLTDPWPVAALVAWVLALALYLWATLLMPRHFPRPEQVRASAGLVYLASVVAMIVVIQLGRFALIQIDREALVPALTVFAVGVHFFPFASAFRAPFFTRLAWIMSCLGLLALVLGLVWGTQAATALVVLNGLVMLVMMAWYAMAMRPGPAPSAGS
ncbi:hypothetical protein [Propioniciclava soli]|uniref:hypothetical protein n=1 Tax=Propioniciclava soli TaxID=2775081 RepID=UPI001E483148|nr:hypothetical protein [Propioniciclava soli]